jgi:signal peptidase II
VEETLMPKRPIVPLVLAVLAVDQLSKQLLKDTQSALIPGLLRITGTRNTGAAFGIFGNSALPLILLTALAVLLIGFYLWKAKPTGLIGAGLTLILSGALGNLIDRAARGYVIDFIELEFVRFAIFNVADMAITLGCVLAFIGILRSKEVRHG